MLHLEGRVSVEAALQAGRRRISVILLKEGAHEEKLEELLAAAERRKVAVKRVPGAELDTLAHGRSHGGVLALCVPLKPLEVGLYVQLSLSCPLQFSSSVPAQTSACGTTSPTHVS